MATFTLTITNMGLATDLRQTAPKVTEQLRNAADELVRQGQINQSAVATPFTKTDGYGNTVYSWTIA